MLPLRTPQTKGMEMDRRKNVRIIGGCLMDMAEDGSVHGSIDSAEKATSTIPPTPTESGAITNTPTPTKKEAGMPSEKPTHPKQKGTSNSILTAPTSSKSSSSNNDKKDEEHMSWFIQSLGHNPDYVRMLHDEIQLLAHRDRQMGNKSIPTIQQAVNMDT